MAQKQESPSIKKNYIYNTALTILNILFPLVTFPYVSRILGPEGIGKFGLANSLSGYFVMVAALGIPLYGLREISKRREDREKRSSLFTSLFIIGVAATCVSLIIYLSLFLFVPKMQADRTLFLVAGINIVLTAFSIDWLYQGMENYSFITLRSLAVKVFSLVLIFVLVKNTGDYIAYTAITVLALGGGNIWNILKSREHADLKLKGLKFREHLGPIFWLFLAAAIGSVYNVLDTVLLGFLSTDKAVGFYVLDRKLTSLTITFVTSLGAVLVPRLSYYISSGRKQDYKELAEKSVNFIYFLALPALAGVICLAPDIMTVFGGNKFVPGALSLQLIAPIILITSIDAFIGFQVLIPNQGEKAMMISNVFGAVTNLLLNYFLIPRFQQNASAVAIVISESAVLAAQVVLGRKYFHFRFWNKLSLNYLIGAVLIVATVLSVKLLPLNFWLSFSLAVGLSGLVYGGFLLLRRDEFVLLILGKIPLLKRLAGK